MPTSREVFLWGNLQHRRFKMAMSQLRLAHILEVGFAVLSAPVAGKGWGQLKWFKGA
jgi:ABC-type proline/glycine betaine transport system permease subunit